MGSALSATKKNFIWLVIARLAKLVHFQPIYDTWNIERLAQLYMKEISSIAWNSIDIVFDRYQRFQTRCWQAFKSSLGLS